jgi:hypothetical protein
MPEFCAEQCTGPAASIDVSQLAPYGARLEVKLDQPSPSVTSVVVEFEAISRPPSHDPPGTPNHN